MEKALPRRGFRVFRVPIGSRSPVRQSSTPHTHVLDTRLWRADGAPLRNGKTLPPSAYDAVHTSGHTSRTLAARPAHAVTGSSDGTLSALAAGRMRAFAVAPRRLSLGTSSECVNSQSTHGRSRRRMRTCGHRHPSRPLIVPSEHMGPVERRARIPREERRCRRSYRLAPLAREEARIRPEAGGDEASRMVTSKNGLAARRSGRQPTVGLLGSTMNRGSPRATEAVIDDPLR
jgi:hypothetical protein